MCGSMVSCLDILSLQDAQPPAVPSQPSKRDTFQLHRGENTMSFVMIALVYVIMVWIFLFIIAWFSHGELTASDIILLSIAWPVLLPFFIVLYSMFLVLRLMKKV